MADEVRIALSGSAALRISGASTWMDAGAPVTADSRVSLASDAGVVEYVPGDLTMTVLAGTPLSTIREVAASNRQWLALDPYGSAEGTIGATIATASYGPLAHFYGTPRDQLLGVEFVTGRGEIVRGGGRVTKNVAGFDLTRLVCGSWGSIGIITEMTMRLRALPDADVTVVTPLPQNVDALAGLLRTMRDQVVTPAAHEILNEARAGESGITSDASMLLRFCGNDAGVRVQLQRVANICDATSIDSSVWDVLRNENTAGDIVLRISTRKSDLPALWDFAGALSAEIPRLRMQASAGRGVIRMRLPESSLQHLKLALARKPRSQVIFEKLPAAAWHATERVPNVELNQRARNSFDPQRILNPGILGGDI